jgi:hypothetical protein
MKAASRNLSLRNVLLFIWPLADTVPAHPMRKARSSVFYLFKLREKIRNLRRERQAERSRPPLISDLV